MHTHSQLYGVLYPLVNLAAVVMMYLISPLPSYPKVYMAALAIVFAQFLVQAIMVSATFTCAHAHTHTHTHTNAHKKRERETK